MMKFFESYIKNFKYLLPGVLIVYALGWWIFYVGYSAGYKAAYRTNAGATMTHTEQSWIMDAPEKTASPERKVTVIDGDLHVKGKIYTKRLVCYDEGTE